MIELCTCIDGYFLFTKSWPKGRIRNTVLEGLEMLIHFWVPFLSYFLIIFITRIKIITKIQLTQYSRLLRVTLREVQTGKIIKTVNYSDLRYPVKDMKSKILKNSLNNKGIFLVYEKHVGVGMAQSGLCPYRTRCNAPDSAKVFLFLFIQS
jgi:hypothetical protein